MTQFEKVYVDVVVRHAFDGRKRPMAIYYEDGQTYQIESVSNCHMTEAKKVGGKALRYTVRIRGKQTYLFEEDGAFFVEAKAATRA